MNLLKDFKFIVINLFIYGIFILSSNGQNSSPSFRHFTTEDGLPSSEVYNVIQDRKGNIWLGTDRGVTRFDGYEFRTFSYKDGLTDNTVFKLLEDKKGRVWMLTISGRIFYFENDKIKPYKFNDKLFNSAQSMMPNAFYIDSLENVLMSFINYGEIKINEKGEIQDRFNKKTLPGVNYLIEEISPEKLIASVISLNENNENLKILHLINNVYYPISIESKPADRFEAIRLSKDKLVFSNGKSLYLNTNISLKHISDLPGKILSLIKDNNDNIWVGTEVGVFLYDQIGFKNQASHYLDNNYITCILQDHEGGYWFTSLNNGVYYMPGYGIKGMLFNQGRFQKPTSLTNDYSSTVYVGCWNGTLVKMNGDKIKIVYDPGIINSTPVTNLSSIPGDEKIYLSRSKPGYFYREKFYSFKTNGFIGLKTNFIKRSDGEIYCAGTRFIFKSKEDSILPVAIVSQRISCLSETFNHQLLFGSNIGAFVFDDIMKETLLFCKELNNIRVDDIKWSGNNLLFATKGKGLLVFSKDSIIVIDESKGLCSNLVNKILVAGNEVWCTSNKGISHIILNDQDTFKYKITNIQSNDGLFSDEINDITLLNDTVYVATNFGISFFGSKTDFVNHKNPPVYISSLRINNLDTSFKDVMELPHNFNNLQIGFNGISYRSKGRIKYRYQLITGTDTISSFTSNREVEFLSLHPGEYKFQVSAMNNSGVWSLMPAVFSFTINPAWWQTFWFKMIIVLLAASGVYLFFRNKVEKLRYNFEMERRQATLQLTAMRAQMNPHFIFNVMNSIRNYMQNHDMKSAEKYLTSFSKLVRYVLDNSEVQEITLEEELNALRNYTELEIQRFENGFEFNIIVENGIILSETYLLSLLLQPFVENAIKHGISRMKSGGKILIDIRKTGESILIAVEDNGVGITEASRWNEAHRETHISHGTTINMERIEAYNKVFNKKIKTRIINLSDNEGKSVGTRVEVEI